MNIKYSFLEQITFDWIGKQMSATESNIETFVIEVLKKLDWEYVHGLSITPSTVCVKRESFEQIILIQRLRKAAARLNLIFLRMHRKKAVQKVLRIYSPDILNKNETHIFTPARYAVVEVDERRSKS